MIEIRIHGRGGQGAVTCSYLIAIAAFHEGFYSQAFPTFGVERRGAPTRSFVRIDKERIYLREQIYNPEIALVMDESLIEDALEGLKENGILIINSKKKYSFEKYKTFCLDLSSIAKKHLGRDIISTAMLGAFCGVTGMIKLNNALKALEEIFSEEILEKNKKVVEESYEVGRKISLGVVR